VDRHRTPIFSFTHDLHDHALGRWPSNSAGEDNGDSLHHQALVPITACKLDLGTWQRVFYGVYVNDDEAGLTCDIDAWLEGWRRSTRTTATFRRLTGACWGEQRRHGSCRPRVHLQLTCGCCCGTARRR